MNARSIFVFVCLNGLVKMMKSETIHSIFKRLL